MPDSAQAVRILIADDEAIFRDSMKKLLNTEPGLVVVGEASDGEEALRLVKLLEPDILLADWQMPVLSGREILQSLSTSQIKSRTIILTVDFREERAIDAFAVGARGLVVKKASFVVLVQSLRAVMDGRYWILDRSAEDLDGFVNPGSAESLRKQPQRLRPHQDRDGDCGGRCIRFYESGNRQETIDKHSEGEASHYGHFRQAGRLQQA